MTGTISQALASEHVQDLLREAEKQRRGRDALARPSALRRALSALGRTRRSSASSPHAQTDQIDAMPAAPQQFLLDDCRAVFVRRLRADDRAMYEAAVAGLSTRSRYLRFAAPMARVSNSLLDQMMNVDDNSHVAYVALAPGEQTIVGVARFIATGPPGVAEVALAIADDWQGHGLGFELLCSVIEHARCAKLQRLIATTLSENAGAARLARAGGFSVSSRAGIYTEYEMPLRELARSVR